jgi:hypothetical protein
MDEQRLAEIEAMRTSLLEGEDSGRYDVHDAREFLQAEAAELVAEVRRLQGICERQESRPKPEEIHPHLAGIEADMFGEAIVRAARAIKDRGPLSAIALRHFLTERNVSYEVNFLMRRRVIQRVSPLPGETWPRYRLTEVSAP